MICDYKTEDADAVVSIWQAASRIAHPFLVDDFIAQEADNLRNMYLVHAKTKVLEIDGQAVGLIAMIGNEVGGLFLDPKMHGKGLGRALVDAAAQTYGVLEVEVFARNEVGRRFYDRYGFRQIGISMHEATGETVLRLVCDGTSEEAVA